MLKSKRNGAIEIKWHIRILVIILLLFLILLSILFGFIFSYPKRMNSDCPDLKIANFTIQLNNTWYMKYVIPDTDLVISNFCNDRHGYIGTNSHQLIAHMIRPFIGNNINMMTYKVYDCYNKNIYGIQYSTEENYFISVNNRTYSSFIITDTDNNILYYTQNNDFNLPEFYIRNMTNDIVAYIIITIENDEIKAISVTTYSNMDFRPLVLALTNHPYYLQHFRHCIGYVNIVIFILVILFAIIIDIVVVILILYMRNRKNNILIY